MLNLRVAFGASRTSHFFHFVSLNSKSAQSSRHFVLLEPRTFFVLVYFASLMQRKYLAEFLELKKVSG